MAAKTASSLYERVSFTGAALSILLGLTVIFGWLTHQPKLIQVLPSFVPMQFNTALCFALAGLSVYLSVKKVVSAAIVFGSVTLFIGLVTLAQYLSGFNVGLDELFVKHYISTKSYHPGRMAPNTALCFTLVGTSLLLLNYHALNDAIRYFLVRIGSIGVVALGLIAFMGYVSGIEAAYGWGHLTRMAVHTSVGMMILGLAVYLSCHQAQHAGYKMGAWGIPACMAMVAIVVSLWQSLVDNSAQQVKYQVASSVHATKNGLEIHWKEQLSALLRMVHRWEISGGTSEREWKYDAGAYVNDMSGLRSLAWVNSTGSLTWQYAIGKADLMTPELISRSIAADTLNQAQHSGEYALSDVFSYGLDDNLFLIVLPLFVEEQYDGLIIGLYHIEEFVTPSIDQRVRDGYAIQITVDGNIAYNSLEGQDQQTVRRVSLLKANDWSFQEPLESPSHSWSITITPSPTLLAKLHSPLPLYVLITGLLFSVGLTVLLYFGQLTRRQSADLSKEIKYRKRFEQDLHSARDSLRLAASVSQLGIWEWSVETGELVWDEKMRDIYELSSVTKVAYEHWRSKVHPDDIEEAERELSHALNTKSEWSYEFRIVLNNQEVRYIRARAACVLENDKVVKMIGGNLDFTEERRIIDELRETKLKAEEANKSKSEFLANMSHEIRTPMNGVLGVTELLSRTALSPQQKDYLNMVRGSANSLLNILNDILDLSKIEAGKLEFENIPFDAREHIGDAVKCFAVNAHRKNLELILFIAPDVPDWLIGDPIRLKQIIFNLTGNAIKFTSSGQVTVTVEWSALPAPTLKIAVSDTGIGINEEQKSRIFSAFSQADSTTTRNYGGTGLGLSIVSQLVELMGGTLALQSEINEGSTFAIELPTAVADRAPKTELSDIQTRLQALKALVIDQERLSREWTGSILQSLGCQVDSGSSLTDLYRNDDSKAMQHDLLIVDSLTPNFDIESVLSVLKGATESDTHLILIARSETDSLTNLPEWCVDRVRILIQPVKQSEVYNCLIDFFAPAEEPVKNQPDAKKSMSHARVLVAEDNEVNQILISDLLEEDGHEVTLVANGEQAVEAVKGGNFDFVLMDVQMPLMDGLEATRAIRKLGYSIPIIALTANAFKEDRDKCIASGMDDFLTKPIDIDALNECIERWGNKAINKTITEESTKPDLKEMTPEPADIVDLGKTLKLVRQRQDRVAKLIDTFVTNIPEKITRIDSALSNQDSASLRTEAHNLKGSIGYFTSCELIQLLEQLEANEHSSTWQELSHLWEQSKQYIDVINVELLRHQSGKG